jgi:glycosyltransferase involved in cell wall biosynthesis
MGKKKGSTVETVPNMVSIICTVKNEEKNMRNLMDSLIIQEEPYEVIIVDAASTDKTREIVKEYQKKYDKTTLEIYAAQRGASRNHGITIARGEYLAFIDGDCIANPFWLTEFRESLKKYDVVGGRTITMGYEPFVELGRVELYYKGQDVTMPSCNLIYKKKVLDMIGGFDNKFVTAEDIDLNVRAVQTKHKLGYNDQALVYALARSTIVGFFKQAFWNGLGRKQLSQKHGTIWGKYDYSELFKNRVTFWYMVRMAVALLGYLTLKFMPFKEYRIKKRWEKPTD